jgi:thioredoxin reductase (NADPH)
MMDRVDTKVLIIGSGAAGYTAALYASRAGLEPILLRGPLPGGQLTTTTKVENFPGFSKIIEGPWLMDEMARQAESVGAHFIDATIVGCDLLSRPFRCWDDRSTIYSGNTLIVATGAQTRWLGLDSEKAFRGRGVSSCATCDGVFHRGQDVVVVGGGNSAVQEALHLAHLCKSVTLIHRRDKLRAEKMLQDRLAASPLIRVRWNTVVEEVHGDLGAAHISGVRLKDVQTGELSTLECTGLFVTIGHTPATSLFEGLLDLDEEGYIRTAPDSTRTNVDGVFAAGDVKDKVFRQAVTAAGLGCMAALEAQRFLETFGASAA